MFNIDDNMGKIPNYLISLKQSLMRNWLPIYGYNVATLKNEHLFYIIGVRRYEHADLMKTSWTIQDCFVHG